MYTAHRFTLRQSEVFELLLKECSRCIHKQVVQNVKVYQLSTLFIPSRWL